MTVQSVVKGVSENVDTKTRSELYHVNSSGVDTKVAVAPVSGDRKGGATLAIPLALTIDVSEGKTRMASCVLTDDEGNVLSDAFTLCTWSSNATTKITVDQEGVVTPLAAGGATITAAALGLTDECTVTVTEV